MAGDPRRRGILVSVLCAAVIAAGAFVFHLSVERAFYRLGAFNQFNVLFDSDPNEVLESMADGTVRRGLIHPNLPYFFSVPLRAAAKLISAAGSGGRDEHDLRRRLAFFLVPLAAAVKVLALFAVFRLLGFSLPAACLLVVLAALSFCQMIYGGMPETYVISSAAIGLMCLLHLMSRDRDRALLDVAWVVVGAFATGITVTNIVPFGLLYGSKELARGRPPTRAAGKVAVLALLVVGANLAGMWIGNRVYGSGRPELAKEAAWVDKYFAAAPASRALMFPAALLNTIAPGEVSRIPDDYAHSGSRYWFALTVEEHLAPTSVRNLLGVGFAAALFAAPFLLLRARRSAFGYLPAAAMAIIGFNWVLHSFWGKPRFLFLYAEHWHVPLLILIACLVAALERRRFAILLLAGVVLAVAVNNVGLLRQVLDALAV